MKKVVTIQDISCFGKCSLTVALPVISAMGIETAVIPTAVLSTHTGGFQGWTFRDLTNDIPDIAAHWKKLDLKFDAIYTGYLGSKEQIKIVSDFFDDFGREDNLIIFDPVDEIISRVLEGVFADIICEHITVVIYRASRIHYSALHEANVCFTQQVFVSASVHSTIYEVRFYGILFFYS